LTAVQATFEQIFLRPLPEDPLSGLATLRPSFRLYPSDAAGRDRSTDPGGTVPCCFFRRVSPLTFVNQGLVSMSAFPSMPHPDLVFLKASVFPPYRPFGSLSPLVPSCRVQWAVHRLPPGRDLLSIRLRLDAPMIGASARVRLVGMAAPSPAPCPIGLMVSLSSPFLDSPTPIFGEAAPRTWQTTSIGMGGGQALRLVYPR